MLESALAKALLLQNGFAAFELLLAQLRLVLWQGLETALLPSPRSIRSLCLLLCQAWPPAVPAVASSFPFSQGSLTPKTKRGSLRIHVSTASSPCPVVTDVSSLGWPVHSGSPRACWKKRFVGQCGRVQSHEKAHPNFLLLQSGGVSPSLMASSFLIFISTISGFPDGP